LLIATVMTLFVNVGEGVEEGDPVQPVMPGSAGLTN
jgi:hypothetical protein